MKLVSTKEVLILTSIRCRSSLWRAVKDGKFPAPKRLGANRNCWELAEIEAWADALPRRDYAPIGRKPSATYASVPQPSAKPWGQAQ
jgi:predicted DNA-binding transcriptional regulator AlpA